MIQGQLSELTDNKVDNVLIYISDSHRYDEIPDVISEMGVVGRATAASGHTPAGYPSILTGLYPSAHQVWEFSDSLSKRPPLLTHYENSGIDATHVWGNVNNSAQKPPLSICGETEETTIEDVNSPFILIVHDVGGHMQYGSSDKTDQWDTHWDFFNEFEGKHEDIMSLYRESLEESVDHFQSIIDTLKLRNELDDTLIIFTADHGEILGEYGGLYTHGAPLTPELVRVPMVFAGAGLPKGVEFDRLLSTTDVAPTALSALGAPISDVDGSDVWTETVEPRRITRAEMWQRSRFPTGLHSYKATSVWTSNGGVVRHVNRLSGRVGHFATNTLFRAPYSNIVRRPSKGLLSLAKSYLSREIAYGTPLPSRLVDEHLKTDFSNSENGMASPTPDTEQLRQLGYLE